jgi:hypothetical protein
MMTEADSLAWPSLTGDTGYSLKKRTEDRGRILDSRYSFRQRTEDRGQEENSKHEIRNKFQVLIFKCSKTDFAGGESRRARWSYFGIYTNRFCKTI